MMLLGFSKGLPVTEESDLATLVSMLEEFTALAEAWEMYGRHDDAKYKRREISQIRLAIDRRLHAEGRNRD